MDKKYTQGFTDGVDSNAKAIADFNKKQAEALETVKELIIKKIGDHGEILDFVIDELEYNENLRNFGLKKDYSINELEDVEKELICYAVYTLLSEYEENNELQKKFFYGIQKQLEISEYQTIDLYCLLNVDSNSACNTMFRILCEFLFLKSANFDFMEKYPWLMDMVRRSEHRKTVDFIEKNYHLLGLEVFVSHYNFSDEIFEPVSSSDSNKIGVPETMGEIKIDKNMYINKGKTETFTNKKVHVSSYITCEGSLVFENCIIFYNESTADEISLKRGASLVLDNCQVVCKGLDTSCFITAEKASSVRITRCRFEDCSYFISGVENEFEMTDCHIINAGNDFIKVRESIFLADADGEKPTAIIDNCLIERRELAEFNLIIKSYLSEDEINDWKERGMPVYEPITIFDLSKANVSDVQFVGSKTVDADIEGFVFYADRDDVKFTNCQFEMCDGAISGGCIESCEFDNCTRVIYNPVSVEHCTFQNCIDNVIRPDHKTKQIGSCIFASCSCTKDSIIPINLEYVEKINIEKCKFANCDFGNEYAISVFCSLTSFHTESSLKLKKIGVSNLSFWDCATSRTDKIVCNSIARYNKGVFRDKIKSLSMFDVYNSVGIDSVKYIQR